MADLISMLAACAGGGEKDPDFNQTVLLLHGDGTNGAQNNTFLDSSTNNFTITRNGNTTQGTFSPFSLAAGEWSNYFDGTDDYLSVADNAVLRPGAGAFTLEAWIYRNASGAAHTVYAKGGASTGIVLQVTSTNVLRFTHTTTNIDSTGTVAANAWVHVAVVREGTGTNQTKLYINGVQDGQGTVSTDFTQTEEVRIGTNRGATDDFAGYISNVRFVKGSALYTAGFTPSTVPLTTTSQGASSSEVELLTCQSNRFVDNSTNAFAITRNNDVKVTPFSPFAPTAAYSAGTNGGSGYFDGTGDCLSVPDDASWAFGSGDFTIEGWLYRTKAGALQLIVLQSNNASASGSAWLLDVSSSNNFDVGLYSGSTAYNLAGGTAPLNEWTHVAVVRSSTRVSFFVNGVRTATNTAISTNALNDVALPVSIGARSTAADAFGGWISSFRIIKGSGPYDAASTTLTVPTAPLTAISNTGLLLNFTNAGIFDNTGKNNLETVGNAQIDTTTKKYGTGSLEFDGTGDGLSIRTTPEFIYGTGDFTIECWVYLNTTGTFGIFGHGDGSSTNPYLYIDTSTPRVYFNITNVCSGPSISTGAWTHLAVTRSGTTMRVFTNGVSGTSVTNADSLTAGGPITIGISSANTQVLNGYIDDLRITKGVARYTANFTPPTAAFPNE